VKITIEVPDDVAAHLVELEVRLKRLEADTVGTEQPVPEEDIDLVSSGIGLEFKRRLLQHSTSTPSMSSSTDSATPESAATKPRSSRKKAPSK